MTKSKRAVRPAKDVPNPKQSGVIRQTEEWKHTVAEIELGKSIEIRLPEAMNEAVTNPINAFMAALKRKYRRTYQIYARNSVIYAVPKR